MLRYFIKRIFIFLPTLIAVTLLAFGLSKMTPGDPIECHLPLSEMSESSSANKIDLEREYRRTAQSLNLDLPSFYFNFTAAAYPDTLYRILNKDERICLKKLIAQYGNWPLIQAYSHALRDFDLMLADLPDSLNKDALIDAKRATKQLFIQYDTFKRNKFLEEINNALSKDDSFFTMIKPEAEALFDSHEQMITETNSSALWRPALYWYGFDNQYHRWVTSFFTG